MFDLATWARERPVLAGYLMRTTTEEIVAACQSQCAPATAGEHWGEFVRRFAEHVARFGHAVYDLDFAKGRRPHAGDELQPLDARSHRSGRISGHLLSHGIGASPGRVTGVARVIAGSDEFNQMQPADILVAKITTRA